MGWLSKFFGTKKPSNDLDRSSFQEVGIEEATEIIKGQLEEKNWIFKDDIKQMHTRMLDASMKFLGALMQLKTSPGPSKIDQGLFNMVNSYRASLVGAFNETFMEVRRSVRYTLEDFESYFNRCCESLHRAESGVSKFIGPLKEVFPGSMNNVMKASEQMSRVVAGIKSDLDKKTEETKGLLYALNAIRNLKSTEEKIRGVEMEIEKKKSEIDQLQAKKKQAEQRLSEIEAGSEWQGYQRMLQDLKSIERKRDEINSVVLQSIVPLDKAMKKLKKTMSEKNEPFPHADLLGLYIEDPVSAFLRDSDQEAINSIIDRIKGAVASGELEIDDKRAQKVLERISSVESGNFLSGLRRDYDSIERSVKKIENEARYASVVSEKSGLEREVKDLDSSIGRAKSELEELEKNMKSISENKKEIFSNFKEVEGSVLGNKRLKDL